jgi:hypothetical protein
MTSIAPRLGKFTFSDFLVLVNDGAKADLLDGIIYMASPESTDENELGSWLWSKRRPSSYHVVEALLREG